MNVIDFITSLQYCWCLVSMWRLIYIFLKMYPSCCGGIGILGAATVIRSIMPVGWHDSPKSVRKSCSIVAFVASVTSSLLICRSLVGHCVFLLRISSLILLCWKEQGGVVVKLLACGERGQWFNSRSRRCTISEIGYLLLPSRDMAEISLFTAT